jgi:hypothetical protein
VGSVVSIVSVSEVVDTDSSFIVAPFASGGAMAESPRDGIRPHRDDAPDARS